MIRKMTHDDVKFVHEIECECFSIPWSEKALEEEVENETAKFLVAETDGKVVGYGGMHLVLGEGFVTNIAVTQSYRGRKIAENICKNLIDLCDISLSLEVRESNFKAINLYTKLGFEKVGQRKNFYQNPTETALIMTVNK